MAGIDQNGIGGRHEGASFPAGTHFSGATFVAPCSFGPGCIFEGCTWECLRACGFGGKNCCPPVSQVGEGAIIIGGTFEYVSFDSSGRMTGGSIGPEGNATLPDCVDCGSWGEVGTALTTTGNVITTQGGQMTEAEFCAARAECSTAGAIVVNGGGLVTVVTGTYTVSG